MNAPLKQTLAKKTLAVANKLERWRDYARTTPDALTDLKPGIDLMTQQVERAHEALATDDMMEMIEARNELAIHTEEA